MTVAFIFEVDPMTADQYDGIMGAMGLGEPGSVTGVAGAVAHLAGPKDGGGWRVIDVWDSEESANAFYTSDQFAPVPEPTLRTGVLTMSHAVLSLLK